MFSRALPPNDVRLQAYLPVVDVGLATMQGWRYAPEYSLSPDANALILICPKCADRLHEKEQARL